MVEAARLLSLSDVRIEAAQNINPHANASFRIIYEWCNRFGIDCHSRQHIIMNGAYLFPNTSLSKLIAIDLLNATLCHLDMVYSREGDHIDQEALAKVYRQCIRTFIDGSTPSSYHRLYHIWAELHRLFKASATMPMMERLAQAMIEYFQATFLDYDSLDAVAVLRRFINASTYPPRQTSSIEPDQGSIVEQYLDLRVRDSHQRIATTLIEFAYDLNRLEEFWNTPPIRRATDVACVLIALINDVFEYETEVLERHSHFNLIALMMKQYELSFAQAVHECISLINKQLAVLDGLISDEPPLADALLHKQRNQYLQGLRDQVNGMWHWHYSTNRYRSPTSPFPELRTFLSEVSNRQLLTA